MESRLQALLVRTLRREEFPILKTKKTKEPTLIWAIDPLIKNSRKLESTKRAVSAWRKKRNVAVMPVSILFPEDFNLPISAMAPWGEKLQTLTEKAIKPFLKSLQVKNMLEPGVLVSPSKSESVGTFLNYAKKQSAKLIMTSTHEARSDGKFRIGNFTQKLIEKSPIPVLSIRSTSEVPVAFSRIIFPTDFSDASEKSFKTLISIAKELDASIVVYHDIQDPVLPAAEFTGIPETRYEVISHYARELEKHEQSQSKRWKKLADNAGLEFAYRSERSTHSLSQSILTAARKEKADMIAMGIESHPFVRAFLGSSVREVIVQSAKPVLVINSSIKKQKRKKK